MSGYVNTSYNYLLRSNEFSSGYFNRENDIDMNGFTLQQFTFTLRNQPKQGMGEVVTIITGRDATSLAMNGLNPDVFDHKQIAVTPGQAYLQYAINSYVFKAGALQSLAGIETFDYSGDSNFSRSILDNYAQPGTHIGLRGIKRWHAWGVVAGISNGWSTVRQPTRLNTGEVGVGYHFRQQFFLIDFYAGPNYLTDFVKSGPTGQRRVFDVFGNWNITDLLSVAANYDYGMQTKGALANGGIGCVRWQGIAAYFNYQFKEKWRTSVRGEIFNDPNGTRTGVKQALQEVTLTLGYHVLKGLDVVAETRHDFSNNGNAFQNKSGLGTSNNQQSYALDVLYQF